MGQLRARLRAKGVSFPPTPPPSTPTAAHFVSQQQAGHGAPVWQQHLAVQILLPLLAVAERAGVGDIKHDNAGCRLPVVQPGHGREAFLPFRVKTKKKLPPEFLGLVLFTQIVCLSWHIIDTNDLLVNNEELQAPRCLLAGVAQQRRGRTGTNWAALRRGHIAEHSHRRHGAGAR